jgi:hypothetical protein
VLAGRKIACKLKLDDSSLTHGRPHPVGTARFRFLSNAAIGTHQVSEWHQNKWLTADTHRPLGPSGEWVRRWAGITSTVCAYIRRRGRSSEARWPLKLAPHVNWMATSFLST